MKATELISFLKRSRIAESVLMTFFFLTGLIYGAGSFAELISMEGLFLVIKCYLLVQAIYLFNSLSGIPYDIFNRRFDGKHFEPGSKRSYLQLLSLSVALLTLSLAISWHFGWNTWFLLIINYILWVLYSANRINLKADPLGGSLVHLLSGMINFHLCYLAFLPADARSLTISVYFALLFVAGHFHHMVIDHAADENAGLNTFAVKYGKDLSEKMSIVVVLVSCVYFQLLAFGNFVRGTEATIVIGGALIHLGIYLYYRTTMSDVRAGLRYRSLYRAIHFTVVAAIGIYNLA